MLTGQNLHSLFLSDRLLIGKFFFDCLNFHNFFSLYFHNLSAQCQLLICLFSYQRFQKCTYNMKCTFVGTFDSITSSM